MRARPQEELADLALAEELARRARERPGLYRSVQELATAGGTSVKALDGALRRSFHTTAARLLVQARTSAAARALLRGRRAPDDVAADVGFESPSAFRGAFRRHARMSPEDFSGLARRRELVLSLPRGFRPDELLSLLGRSAAAHSERVQGGTAWKAMVLAGEPALLRLALAPGSLRCTVESARPTGATMAAAHAALLRMLGLTGDPAAFERHVERHGFGRLVGRRRGLRIPGTADVFEGLVWVIVGQQVNVGFASTCRDRLIALCGTPVGEGFIAHPSPERVARLGYGELVALQFSRRKAEYLIDAARAIASGALDLEGLRDLPVPRVVQTLTRLRGLGPWSVQYLLMRSLGFQDCVPVGDVALSAALQRFFAQPERPAHAAVHALMAPFAPHRSLATFHLWKSLEGA